jgi:hypothetical protein
MDALFAWLRQWWFLVLVVLIIAIGIAAALVGSDSRTGY